MNYRICFNAQEFLDAMRVAMQFADKDGSDEATNCIYIGKMPDEVFYSMVACNGKMLFRFDMTVHGLLEGEPLPQLPVGPDYNDDLPPEDLRRDQYFFIPLKDAKSIDKVMPKKLTGKEWIFFDIVDRKEEAGGGYKVTVELLDTSYSYSVRNYSMYDWRHLFNGFENWADMQERPVFTVKFLELLTKAFKGVEKVRVVQSETKLCFMVEDPDGKCPYKLLMATFVDCSHSDKGREDQEEIEEAV